MQKNKRKRKKKKKNQWSVNPPLFGCWENHGKGQINGKNLKLGWGGCPICSQFQTTQNFLSSPYFLSNQTHIPTQTHLPELKKFTISLSQSATGSDQQPLTTAHQKVHTILGKTRRLSSTLNCIERDKRERMAK